MDSDEKNAWLLQGDGMAISRKILKKKILKKKNVQVMLPCLVILRIF